MHPDFLNLSTTLKNEALLKTELLFTTQNQIWLPHFSNHFQSICTKIANKQKESTLPPISRLEYTMLKTNFINRHYKAEIWVYNEKRYLDKNQEYIGEYDLNFLFYHFEDLWNKLLTVRKRYAGKVTSREITKIMLQTLPNFYSYLTNLARPAIKPLITQSPFTDIVKTDTFKVNIGDYMSATEPIYTENKNKDAKKLIQWFTDRLENAYTFEDFSHLDFSNQNFTYTEFRYSQFRHTNLSHTNLQGSALIGANFHQANLEHSTLDNCSIYEADFSQANLKNATLTNTRGRAGLPNEKEWRHVGFLPINFRQADLTNANFSGAKLQGADFTGAKLSGANFSNADLTDAIFDEEVGEIRT